MELVCKIPCSPALAAVLGDAAVSYTHLDVYKRQRISTVFPLAVNSFPAQENTAVTVSYSWGAAIEMCIRDSHKMIFVRAVGSSQMLHISYNALCLGLDPVSYTHLHE